MTDPPSGPWAPRTATRGPRPALSLEEIAAAGIALADGGGLAAVSMRAVAESLEVTKMALYRYVRSRDELVAAMVDSGLGPPEAAQGPWRQGLSQWACALMTRFREHPWALAATVGPRPVGPNELAWLEVALALLARAGVPAGQRLDALVVLTGQARTVAEQSAAEQAVGGTLLAQVAAAAQRQPGGLPALGEALAARAEAPPDGRIIIRGLGWILDGIEQARLGTDDAPGLR